MKCLEPQHMLGLRVVSKKGLDAYEHSFFGVRKKEITPKMVEEARAKGVEVINYPTKFTGDYTQVPRGRVAWNVNKFIVLGKRPNLGPGLIWLR